MIGMAIWLVPIPRVAGIGWDGGEPVRGLPPFPVRERGPGLPAVRPAGRLVAAGRVFGLPLSAWWLWCRLAPLFIPASLSQRCSVCSVLGHGWCVLRCCGVKYLSVS